MNGALVPEVSALLGMRRHLSIVHHLPGRIRLRVGPALWGIANKVEENLLKNVLDHLAGIRDVRINMAVASVVIEYDATQIHPDNWETLVRGDADAAGDLLSQWLARNGQSLRYTLDERSKQ